MDQLHQTCIAKSISCLTHAVRAYTEQYKIESELNRSNSGLATLKDLLEMENRMAIKISELKGEVSAIRVQVSKIWGEQQKKYDDLVVKFNALEEKLAAAELDAPTTQELADFKTDLQAFDDTIPDLETPPVEPAPEGMRRSK